MDLILNQLFFIIECYQISHVTKRDEINVINYNDLRSPKESFVNKYMKYKPRYY